MFSKATRIVVVAVVGAALLVGLLAVGTVTVAGPPGPPPKPPKPEPTPRITPAQIVDGVNRLLPHSKTYRPGDPGFDELAGNTPPNRIPSVGAARSLEDGSYLLAFAREGVRLFAARSLDDGPFIGRAGGTRLGAIELARDYELGSGPLKQGYYHIAAIYDPKNELDAGIDPKNETDFYLVLVADLDNDGEIEIWAFIGLPHRELARVMGMVDPQLQLEFAQGVLLNLVAALLQ